MKDKIRRWLPLALLVLAVWSLRTAVVRPLWFDEALTLLNFVMLPHPSDIYWNYAIPNNHIFFSYLLRGMAEMCWLFGLGVIDPIWRSVSLAAAAVAVMVMYRCWKRRCGEISTFLVLACLVLSPAFMIYATAVRGYMVGFLGVLLAMECGRRFMAGRKLYLLGYALAAALAAATIPTNLLALAAVVLWLVPRMSRDGRAWRRWLVLALLPLAAFLLFYLPLWTSLLHHLALKEGWRNGWRGASMVYAGLLVPMLPLVLLMAPSWCAGALGSWRRRRFWVIAVLVAAPLLAVPIFHPYLFPRTFFVWWPLWLYLLAAGLHRCRAWCRRRKVLNLKTAGTIPAVLVLIAASLWLVPSCVAGLTNWIIQENELDDYFRPYYIVDYHPEETVQMIKACPGEVYVSFGADQYPLIYYGLLQGIPMAHWRYDGPRGRVADLTGCGLVILSRNDKPEETVARFGLKGLTLVKTNGYHRIYRPEEK